MLSVILEPGVRGYSRGVVVKLYAPEKMVSEGDWELEKDVVLGGYRPWLTAEYTVMTDEEVEEMKAYWDALDNSQSCAIVNS